MAAPMRPRSIFDLPNPALQATAKTGPRLSGRGVRLTDSRDSASDKVPRPFGGPGGLDD